MSWLAKSLANSLLPDHRDDDDGEEEDEIEARRREEELDDEADRRRWGARGEQEEWEKEGAYDDPNRGVKEDLSELTKTLTRQFWGVASFLAPPPTDGVPDASGRGDPAASSVDDWKSPEASDPPPSIAGMRSDLAEIGGRFRSGISKLSSHKAVSEGISRIRSTFLPFGSEGDEYDEDSEEGSERRFGRGAVGVTEEVMAFVGNISMHPETWLDFPLLSDDEELDDFDMSDAQQEHALAVESLSPRLAALRIELCPGHMSDGCFWKIYFVLLHPRLSKQDAELLSTPQIVEARALLLQKLQSQTKLEAERTALGASYRKINDNLVPPQELFALPKDVYEISYSRSEEIVTPSSQYNIESDKHPIHLTDVEVIDKSVIDEEPVKQLQKDNTDSSKIYIERFDEEGDDWLEHEAEEISALGTMRIPLVDDEDVSFSDLEEDADTIAPKPKK